MTHTSGTSLGPYEIVELIAEGGMGEVYRARDTRLGRDVAIKVLNRSLEEDPERRRRFEQEARAVGAISHPNIVAVYDVAFERGHPFVVTELLEGESLRARVAAGPLPPRRVVDFAAQMAQGLAAAHEKGIVHRDLKPENVFVTTDGRIKILDFGLAKDSHGVLGAGPADRVSTLTQPGVLLGTIGYMSPEQVLGRPADTRSDVFSFGAVLYEMLTGKPAFQKESAGETLGAILHGEPSELESFEHKLPPALERVVRRCLQKDPEERFRNGRELAFTLDAIAGLTSSETPSALAAARHPRPPRISREGKRAALFVSLGVLVGLVAGITLGYRMIPPRQADTHSLRFLTYGGRDSSPSVSPDGRTVAFTSDRDGRSRIWLKQMAGAEEVALTEGLDDFPRFSPDGASILFVRSEGGRSSLYRVPALGGEARKLLDDAVEGDWSPDGNRIAFVRLVDRESYVSSVLGIFDTSTGRQRLAGRVANERLAHPRWSPDGKTIAVVPVVLMTGAPPNIYLFPADGGAPRTLRPPAGFGISSAAFVGTGDAVVYALGETPAGGVGGSAGGNSYVIRQNIYTGESQRLFWNPYGSQLMEVCGPGRLVFDTRSRQESLREAPINGDPAARGRWLTRGNSTDRQPVYSPDGEWMMFTSNRGGNLDLWTLHTRTGAVRRVTDSHASDWDPAYVGDGKTIVWSSNRTGHFEIWMGAADGGNARQLTHDGLDAENPSATPDGAWIVYASGNPEKLGLWKVRADGTSASRLVSGSAIFPEVSPDGKYAAYMTNFLPDSVAIRVARVADGSPANFEIHIPIRNVSTSGSLGRLRWMPDGGAIAFLGQNERGVNGVFVQRFAPGRDTSATRRQIGGFDEESSTESFGISPDGRRLTVAGWDQVFSLVLAENVPGVSPPKWVE